jgi:hypothetical protein
MHDVQPVSTVLYRSRVPAPSASSAETMNIVEQADVEGHHGGGGVLNSGDLQSSISTTSFSSASSAGASWRRNNNVDLFVTEEPV